MCDRCECCHVPDHGACRTFEAGFNGRCVYCDHAEECHPGAGPLANGPLEPIVLDRSSPEDDRLVHCDHLPWTAGHYSGTLVAAEGGPTGALGLAGADAQHARSVETVRITLIIHTIA